LDALDLLWREPAPEREVETEIRCMHERTGLMHVLAEESPKGRVEQMRSGVVAHRVAAQVLVHDGLRGGAEPKHAVDNLRAHHDDAGRRRLRVGDERAPLIARDRAAIADLSPALRIARSAFE